MRIIVEGPDNAGKSTLCRSLAVMTGREIIKSCGREASPSQIISCCQDLLSKPDYVIHDRHSIISQTIYGNAVWPNTAIPQGMIDCLYNQQKPLFIYCRARPDRGMEEHVATEMDTKEYLEAITHNYEELVHAYDE